MSFARFAALATEMGVTLLIGGTMPRAEGVPVPSLRAATVLRGARVVWPNVLWLLNRRPEVLAQGIHELSHAIEWAAGFESDETLGRMILERTLAERAGVLTGWELWIRESLFLPRRKGGSVRYMRLADAAPRRVFDRFVRMFRRHAFATTRFIPCRSVPGWEIVPCASMPLRELKPSAIGPEIVTGDSGLAHSLWSAAHSFWSAVSAGEKRRKKPRARRPWLSLPPSLRNRGLRWMRWRRGKSRLAERERRRRGPRVYAELLLQLSACSVCHPDCVCDACASFLDADDCLWNTRAGIVARPCEVTS